LQGLQSKNVLDRMDYLSTVSGGGYIGATLSIAMAKGPDADGAGQTSPNKEATFPFGRLDEDRESPEVKHLRDNSRYLLQNGIIGLVPAVAIYLRGLAMNTITILPILILAAVAIILLNPTTQDLVGSRFAGIDFAPLLGNSSAPVIILGALVVAVLLVLYAVLVSILRIGPIGERQTGAKIAAVILGVVLLLSLLDLHTILLRLAFELNGTIPSRVLAPDNTAGFALFEFIYKNAQTLVALVSPLVVALLPFWKTLATKASQEASGFAESAKQIASRVALLIAAAIMPALLWLVTMQLAYWGTAISICPCAILTPDCQATPDWSHAPMVLQVLVNHTHGRLGIYAAPLIYLALALALFALWPFLNVNSNSLHQLYRDRLGTAFLIRRRTSTDTVDPRRIVDGILREDDFLLSQLDPSRGPYHILNTALNLPGSRFANRRGRNADFFIFSRHYIGSEATGYVDTAAAEKIVDGLNLGTAVAISGAAAAPNMGLVSIRPLSATIAFLNVRLGRWVRHPLAIAELDRNPGNEKADGPFAWGFPRPQYLLYEAFFKSGRDVVAERRHAEPDSAKADSAKADDVTEADAQRKARRKGFIFLSDGGHIENLGIYELLRRRCKLIIAIDGEADENINCASLTQLERLARIDHNIAIRMKWKPIAAINRLVSASSGQESQNGPHVALGLIDYPAPSEGRQREKGVLIYIKASLSGDENDYVLSYKTRHPSFPHETTADQLFSEEQFEVYRALGEHIAVGFVTGRDPVSVQSDGGTELVQMVTDMLRTLEVRSA